MVNKNSLPKTKFKLRKIINKYDPICIYFGKKSNPDEYDPEIEKILATFSKNDTFENFTDKVYDIFTEMFGSDIIDHKSKYIKLSKEIYNYLKK
jgi:hypothetical protein